MLLLLGLPRGTNRERTGGKGLPLWSLVAVGGLGLRLEV